MAAIAAGGSAEDGVVSELSNRDKGAETVIETVTVVRHSEDRLTQWVWRFYYDNRVLWLDHYEELQRSTRRHGFNTTSQYSRVFKNRSDMNESDVVLRADVIDEAVKKFRDGITVKRWSERKWRHGAVRVSSASK